MAREKGVAAYIGEGNNTWGAVHRLDADRVYRLVLEKGTAGARYHAMDEEAIPFRRIAEAIGQGLGVPAVSKRPEEAAEHFGWFARFAAMGNRARSERTRSELGWQPAQRGLLADVLGALIPGRLGWQGVSRHCRRGAPWKSASPFPRSPPRRRHKRCASPRMAGTAATRPRCRWPIREIRIGAIGPNSSTAARK
jgi:hypothetical protein